MAAAPRRSPIWTYLVMAAVAGTVIVGVTLIAEPGRPSQPDRAIGLDAGATLVPPDATPSSERDFLTAVLGSPRVGRGRPYCDARGCCPTWMTTFGTTAPTDEVVAAFEVQGYVATPGDRRLVRGGPWPTVLWTGELDYAGRWEWRRVAVARGQDMDRPAWPTVFVQSSIACGED